MSEILSEDDANRMNQAVGRSEGSRPRLFYLDRKVDVSRVSGTGRVAEGVEFTDGTVVMRWLSDTPTTVMFETVDHVVAIHGHGGSTELVWAPLAPGESPVV